MRFSKASIAAALMLAAAVTVAGCGGSDKKADAPKAAKGGTINISLHQDPPKLDPAISAAFVERHVFQSIFDKLVDVDAKGNIVPMLAEKWTISEDGKKYTFNLRKGVKFHDGTEFNAEAVKFNIEKYKEKGSNRRGELKSISSVKVVDANTIEFILEKPFSPLLSMLADRAGMMRSPEAVKKLGDGFMNAPVGTGPYAYKSRVKGNTITLTKNANYWKKGAPGADTLVYKIMTDANVALVNMKSGQVDMSNRFAYNEVANMKNDAKVGVINEAGPAFKGFYININNENVKDKRVRQAIEKAIDRDVIVKVALSGVGTAGRTALGPTSFAYVPEVDKAQKPDIEGAKKLMAEAGKGQGFKMTIITDVDPVTAQVYQLVQKQLKAINIDLNIEKMDFGTVLDRAKKGNFEMCAISWSGRIDPDGNLYDWFHTGAYMNYVKYSNPEIDKWLEDARTISDNNQRKDLYKKIVTKVADDSPYIFLYHENNAFGISKSLKGFTYIPDGMIRTADMSK